MSRSQNPKRPPGSYKSWQDIARAIATKGVIAFKRGVALATKGILDLIKRPPRKTSLEHPFRVEYDVIGTKEFEYQKLYDIIGKVTSKKSIEITLKGIKETRFVEAINVSSVVEHPLEKHYILGGAKQFDITYGTVVKGVNQIELSKQLDIRGLEEYKLAYRLGISGIKQYDTSYYNTLKGIKEFVVNDTKHIQGIKQIEKKDRYTIKGRRDITSILESLDLI